VFIFSSFQSEIVMLREGGASSNRRIVSAVWALQPHQQVFTGSSAGACHRAGHFGPDPLADDDEVSAIILLFHRR
jgi:hypothetical protein